MIPNLVKKFNAYEQRRCPETWSDLQELVGLFDGTITDISVLDASPHKLSMLVQWEETHWRVRFIPTFFNIDIRIDGQDDLHRKAELASLLREATTLNLQEDYKRFFGTYKKPVTN